jgi:hypothetical protein
VFDPHPAGHYDSFKWLWWAIIAFNSWELLKRVATWYRARRAAA